MQLHQRRGSAGMGPSPLDHAQLLAWCKLHGQRLTPWEVDAVFALDDLWLQVWQEAQPKPSD